MCEFKHLSMLDFKRGKWEKEEKSKEERKKGRGGKKGGRDEKMKEGKKNIFFT